MNSWLLWGAKLFGWAPTQTREVRHGDLLAMSDLLMDNAKGKT